MAGDTLRGIGKKAIAEALEAAAAAAEHATEPNGTAPTSAFALGDDQGRPERSLDELPSERTGHDATGDSAIAPANHTGNEALAGMPITTAPTLVQDAPALTPGAATMPGTSTTASTPASTAINTAVTLVDDAAPLGSSTSAPRSGPNRVSFGTMIGHEVHAVQARVADAEAAVRGTAHGHDVHLPGHPATGVESTPGTAPAPSVKGLPVSRPEPAIGLAEYLPPARDSQNEFSGGDHSFFDTAPINDEYEPENPRGRLYTRLAVSGAVVAVVAVVVVAWANSHSAGEGPPVEVKAQPAVAAPVRTAVAAPARPAPPPAPPQEPPTSTIPSSMPERIAVTTPPPHPAKAPSLAPPAPAAVPRQAVPVAAAAPVPKPAPTAAPPAPKPAPVAAAVPKPASVAAPVAVAPKASAPVAAAPVRELRTPPPPPQKKPTAVAAAAPHPAATSAPHAAAPAPAPAPAPRPAPTVAKAPPSAPSHPVAKSTPARASKAPARGKQKYDPDGTLPLSFE